MAELSHSLRAQEAGLPYNVARGEPATIEIDDIAAATEGLGGWLGQQFDHWDLINLYCRFVNFGPV